MTDETISTADINDLRRRIANGREYSEDEIRKAISQIRSARSSSGDSATKRKQTKKSTDLSDLAGGSI